MNTSTLPPLLVEYLPSYEEKPPIALANVEVDDGSDQEDEQDDELRSSCSEGEKKLKTSRTLLVKKRRMEAEEKALKEKEEKALRTLKMWSVVKANERKRKQKLLKDKVNLQHQIIKKRDELHEVLVKEQQQKEKEKMERLYANLAKSKIPAMEKTVTRQQGESKKDNAHRNKKKIVHEDSEEKMITEVFQDEKPPEFIEKYAFSEEDLSEFLENAMEEANFHELRHQPLHIQLERLFGEKAESYLHPAVKESPRKAPNHALAKKKGYQGATVLWETLRDFSRQKLRNKDALILPDVKNAYACFTRECLRRHITPVKRNFVSEEETPVNMNIEESDLLKDVRYRRHRQELMYRIAHINKDKTRLLLQNSELHYVDMKTNDGLRRFYPQLTQDESEQRLPSIAVTDQLHSHDSTTVNRQHMKTQEKKVKSQQQFFGANLVFLTEAKASCKGRFAKRLVKEDKKEHTLADVGSIREFSKHGAKKHENTPIFCEPLSMDALVNQKSSFLEKRGNYLHKQILMPNLAI